MDGLAVMAPQGRIRVWRGATGGTGRTWAALAVTLAVLAAAVVTPGAAATRAKAVTDRLVHVIVTGAPGAASTASQVVQSAGGHVLHALPIVHGFDAVIPASAIGQVAAANGVRSVTPDVGVHLNSAALPDPTTWPGAAPYSPKAYPGSLYNVAREINADNMWSDGYTGKGVGVALIDSGVAPVPNIAANLVNGPDLSLDATGGPNDGIDAFGHGTHMAGIIAGHEPGVRTSDGQAADVSANHFLGIAPDAKVISVKVATADGSVDVSQVIAGIDWVVQHRNDPGMNIRVLNLSFGTDGVQDYMLDPLTYAAEVAWRAGIVVVVAAGNNGIDHPQLNNPAYDPYVIAVGAQDQNGTTDPGNDVIADFSSRGNTQRRPDLVTPGRSIVSLRDPGSVLDGAFPTAQVGDDQFKGSGTSQSAAVLSGAIALMLQRNPKFTPDQVKAALKGSGRTLKTSSGQTLDQGMKTIDIDQASHTGLSSLLGSLLGSSSKQNFTPANGLGSIDAARGSYHLVDTDSGAVLQGEMDVTGAAWDPQTWSATALAGRTWSGNTWMGRTWTGSTWSGRTWSGRTWSGDAYNGRTWTGRTWSGGDWAGRTWSGRTWSGRTWSSADLDPTATTGA
jgi:subtilisin family serine protease